MKSKQLKWKNLRGFLILGLITTLFLNIFVATGNAQKKRGKRQFLSVGTAPPGGAFFVVGGASRMENP